MNKNINYTLAFINVVFIAVAGALSVVSANPEGGVVEVREGKPDGKLLGSVRIRTPGAGTNFNACSVR